MTADAKELLNKGLSFIPAPQISATPILEAANVFSRRLKLHNYFNNLNRGRNSYQKTPFTGKSNWSPPDSRIDPDLLNCISDFTEEMSKLDPKAEKNNMSAEEKSALKELQNNSDLVFKKADKGSAIVVMDKKDYLFEGYRQLNNPHHYKPLENPIYPETAEEITTILKGLKDSFQISEKQYNYLKPPECPRPRRFYTLPKIHKAAESWTVPGKIPPGRPIVSDCNSESEKVAEYIDAFLKDKARQHPSYIKDTNDFVNKIKNLKIPIDALLISLDVESMYTNIDLKNGLDAVSSAFENHEKTEIFYSVLKLLELSLKNNDFEFNDNFFLQIRGTSMGKKFAPHYADIFMAKFERDALEKCPLKPLIYLRYLDDIFIVWTHGEKAFAEFLTIFNSHQPPIKFKAEIHNNSIDFLDTTIFKCPEKFDTLLTKVYFKPTDSHQLLFKTSFHPKHTFKGVLKSQIIRFYRICSREADFEDAWGILYEAKNSIITSNHQNVLGHVDSTHCPKFIKLQKVGQCQVKFRQGDPLYLIATASRKKLQNILMPF